MSDEYLWDGGGKPDPEVARLEALLGRYRQSAPFREPEQQASTSRHGRAVWIGLAAALVLTAVVGLTLLLRPAVEGWDVTALEGAPRIGHKDVRDRARLPVGGRLATDAGSRASLRIGLIGEAEIGPESSVRLVRAAATDHRLALERGSLRARIWAPPRLFFVDTPSATAIDLGCEYTLDVDAGGAGLLRVVSGWVAFDDDGRESFVPAGAACRTRPGTGPGTPWFEDASDSFQSALGRIDARPADPALRAQALATLLAEARPQDGLSLWHLLARLPAGERGPVFDRLAQLVPQPEAVTREKVLRGERAALDASWDALGLGVTTWWRVWKGSGPPR